MSYVLMSSDYTIKDDKPTIYFFSRDATGKQHVFDTTYRPYFYAPYSEAKKIILDAVPHDIPGIDGRKVTKIKCEFPREVPTAAKRFSTVYEDKLPFPLRFLIDRGIKAGFAVVDGRLVPADDIPNLHMVKCYIDIEMETTKGMNIKKALNLLISISVGWEDGRIKTFTCEDESEEREMLKEVANYILTGSGYGSPDVIIAWNVYYDLSKILKKMQRNFIHMGSLSPMGYSDVRERQVKISGVNVFDLLVAFARYYQSRTFPSYKLDEIVAREEFLGWEEDPFDYEHHMNRNHLDKVVPYNRGDVEKLIKLDDMLHLTNMFDGIRRIAGCRLEDTMFTTMYTDIASLHEYHGKYILGTRSAKGKEKYVGAYVHKPITGMYYSVALVDFAGMYSGIIISNNMSPECLVDETFDGPMREIDGVFFRTDIQGIIPQMILNFVDLRNRAKEKMGEYENGTTEYIVWDAIQYEYKQMIAAIYGSFANPGNRLYYPQISRSVTFVGRKYIWKLIEHLAEQEYITQYADTDSVLTEVGGDGSYECFCERGPVLEKTANGFLVKIASREKLAQTPTVEFEIGYEKLLLGKKKRYAGLVTYYKGKPSNEIMIKGFEARRSDAPIETQRLQVDVIDHIFNEAGDSAIRKRVLDSVDRIKDGELVDVGIPMPLKKNLDEYKVIQNYLPVVYANRFLGKIFGADTRPYVFWMGKRFPAGYPGAMELDVVLKKGPRRRTYKVNRVALENDEDLEKWRQYVDWETQTFKIIDNKLGTILEAYGLSMSEIRSGQKQFKLEAF